MTPPLPVYDHLLAMSDNVGTFEHAVLDQPRRDCGYCVDDIARVAVVVAREPAPTPALNHLVDVSLSFLCGSQSPDGRVRNRRSSSGAWESDFDNGDWWGRAQWAFGTLAVRCEGDERGRVARELFIRGARVTSPYPRSVAMAVLGADELLEVEPDNAAAQMVMARAIALLDRPSLDPLWYWPEERLTYANATLAQGLFVAGFRRFNERAVRRGLDQLAWLMKRELAPGHLRVTPNTGVQRSGWRHGVTNLYDQQPIEVAALAEACARAWRLTGDEKWRRGIEAAYEWFLGRNDGQVPMFDPATGGAFDGLTAHGPNRNQGAESTLAMLATFQTASFIPQPTHGTH